MNRELFAKKLSKNQQNMHIDPNQKESHVLFVWWRGKIYSVEAAFSKKSGAFNIQQYCVDCIFKSENWKSKKNGSVFNSKTCISDSSGGDRDPGTVLRGPPSLLENLCYRSRDPWKQTNRQTRFELN